MSKFNDAEEDPVNPFCNTLYGKTKSKWRDRQGLFWGGVTHMGGIRATFLCSLPFRLSANFALTQAQFLLTGPLDAGKNLGVGAQDLGPCDSRSWE